MPPAVTPVHVADLVADGEILPVEVHVIDHPDGRVLVDTGLTELHPAVADLDPRLKPLSEWALDPASIDLVVNTHLHFDHCGGNHLFAGKPIHVQRRELDDARSLDDYTIREWVEAPGVRYVPVDGELEILPGVRLVPTPGHTPGSQVVVVGDGRTSDRDRRRHRGVLRRARRAEDRRPEDRPCSRSGAGVAFARARAMAAPGRLSDR
jgi:N-acyl homoserine lactone hydrolase